ncbi:MAG: hypothetical protein ACI8R4_000062 [Paracoccaceae bacterium]|jgi:hypothetical protein
MSNDTHTSPLAQAGEPDAPRKPRLALMGEFSAGKSTLSNLLLGADPLPVKVTATRLPPIWISYGDEPAMREDMQGNCSPIDIQALEKVQLEDTRLIRLYLKSDVLQLCDLIDMPGISDPNMASDVWQNVIGEADNVIWCSHATQAWRQSEAAVWESLGEDLRAKSLLLLTRFDKLLTDRDKSRVLTRVRRETDGLFSDIYPVCLTDALVAGEDRALWDKSGAGVMVERLIDLLVNPDGPSHGTYEVGKAAPKRRAEDQAQKSDQTPVLDKARDQAPEGTSGEACQTVRVMPSRVRAKSSGDNRVRPPAKDNRAAAREAALTGLSGNA